MRPTPSVSEPFTGFASGMSPVVTATVRIFASACAAWTDLTIGLTSFGPPDGKADGLACAAGATSASAATVRTVVGTIRVIRDIWCAPPRDDQMSNQTPAAGDLFPPRERWFRLIARYTRPAMGGFWSDERRFTRWLDVEIAAMAGWAELGVVPAEAVAAVRERARVDVARIGEIEDRTHHDVLAFTESVSEQVGEHARWFHYGLTSSDVVDTALALQLGDAGRIVLDGIEAVDAALVTRAEEHRHTPTIGRTHGVHAEPTTFGLKLLGWLMELRRGRTRLETALAGVRVGKLSGAVGAYANTDPRVEEFALGALGPDREPVATQVVARDRHAALLNAVAGVGATLERFALEIRHLQRTEVREAFEPFAAGQKGSSAMPHKRNPIVCERICGLARVLRANAHVGFEDVALWHERDISHSSAERVVLPDSTIALDYMLDRARWLIEG